MRYRFEIEDERDIESWYEAYDVPDHVEPKKFIENMLAQFNAGLHPGETARTMVSFELVGSPKDHDWEKQNIYTIMRAGQIFDRHKCKRCNVTGKRHGISSDINIDSKFKAKVYRQCDTSLAHQKIKEERRQRKEAGIL